MSAKLPNIPRGWMRLKTGTTIRVLDRFYYRPGRRWCPTFFVDMAVSRGKIYIRRRTRK